MDRSSRCPHCFSANAIRIQGSTDRFYQCDQCRGLFRHPDDFPDREEERNRYLQHQNDVTDVRYQQFVAPITDAVLSGFQPQHRGLDFGSGTGPVITKIIADAGFNISVYDPFFAPDDHLLMQRYHYIACCEVIEHFHHPDVEFKQLRKLLLPGGKLFCMTHLYDDTFGFSNWYYKNDPTHVFIYREETMYWIRQAYDFADVEIDGRLIVLSVE